MRRLSRKGLDAEFAEARTELLEHYKKKPPGVVTDEVVTEAIRESIPGYPSKKPR